MGVCAEDTDFGCVLLSFTFFEMAFYWCVAGDLIFGLREVDMVTGECYWGIFENFGIFKVAAIFVQKLTKILIFAAKMAVILKVSEISGVP